MLTLHNQMYLITISFTYYRLCWTMSFQLQQKSYPVEFHNTWTKLSKQDNNLAMDPITM